MAGILRIHAIQDMLGFKIQNLGAPVDPDDAVRLQDLLSYSAIGATYITQTPSGVLTNEQALSTLATGLLKSTTSTGVVSIGVAGVDFADPAMELIAGDGMVGGGFLGPGPSIAFNVAPNEDGSIVVNDDNIQVGIINDGQHGLLSGGFLHALATVLDPGFMDSSDKASMINSTFLVTSATDKPTNAFDLGTLTTGLLKQTVASGTATPSIAIPDVDYATPGAVVGEPIVGNQVRYVAPYGDDSNHGLDWRYPKKYINSAIADLPSGGTINVMNGSYCGNTPTLGVGLNGQGIWLTADSPLPPGFLQTQPYHIIGHGGAQHVAGAMIFMGNMGETNNLPYRRQVMVWLYKSNSRIIFENISWLLGDGVQMRLAVSGNPALDPDEPEARGSEFTTTNFEFHNCEGGFNLGVYGRDHRGPAIDIGYTIWPLFKDCFYGGAPEIDIDDDRRAAMLIKPADGTSMVDLDNVLFGQAGLRYYAGASTIGLHINRLMVEGDSVDPLPPSIDLININNSGTIYMNDVQRADEGPGQPISVRIRGTYYAEQIVAINTPHIDGKYISIGSSNEFANTVDPNQQGRVGFVAGKLYGDTDAARRMGASTTARFRNMLPAHDNADGITGSITALTSLWKSGNATLTTGLPDILGATNAFKLETTGGGQSFLGLYEKHITVNPGDRFALGLWLRSSGGFDGNGNGLIQIIDGTPNAINVLAGTSATFTGDGEWQWHVAGLTITDDDLAGSTTAWVRVLLASGGDTAFDVQACFPIAHHIPANAISDNEFAAYLRHLSSTSQAPIGTVSTLEGQAFHASGGLTVGNSSDPDDPGTWPIDMGANIVTNVADAVDPQDAPAFHQITDAILGGPFVGNQVRHVAPYGDDSNDGLDWRHAKETVLAAVDSLPDGGTIHIMDNSYSGGTVAGQGIWLTNDSTLHPGFHVAKPYHFIGYGTAQHTAGARVLLGQPSVASTLPHRRQVAVWLYQSNNRIIFENLLFYQPWGCHARLAVDGDPAVDPDAPAGRGSVHTTTNFEFKNCATVYDIGLFGTDRGPSIDIGYTIWPMFRDCLFAGAGEIDMDDDRRATILVKPADGTSQIHVENCVGGMGGIKYYGGASTIGAFITNWLVEGDSSTALPPAVELIGLINNGTVYLNNVANADEGPGSAPNVRITTSASTSDQVVCVNTAGVEGPHTSIACQPLPARITDPNTDDHVGFISGKIWGDTDAARRLHSPTAIRFRNLLPVHDGADGITGDITPLTSLFKTANTTLTTGRPDILGGTSAFRIETTDTSQAIIEIFGKNISVSPGDRFAYGFWAKSNGGFDGSNLGDIHIPSGTPNPIAVVKTISRRFAGDGEWQWHAIGLTITNAQLSGTTTANVRFLINTGLTTANDIEICFPVAHHIADGDITDNEFGALIKHLAPVSQAPISSVSTLQGQAFHASGGLVVGNVSDPDDPDTLLVSMGDNVVQDVANPVVGTDAVNLQTLTGYAETPMTFTSGVTRLSGVVTGDYITGKTGSQIWTGSTDSAGALTIRATSHGTTGPMTLTTSQIKSSTFGSASVPAYSFASATGFGMWCDGSLGVLAWSHNSTYSMWLSTDTLTLYSVASKLQFSNADTNVVISRTSNSLNIGATGGINLNNAVTIPDLAGGTSAIVRASTAGLLSRTTIANADIRDSAGLSVIGRSNNSTGTVADITGTANGQVLQISASAIAWGGITGAIVSGFTAGSVVFAHSDGTLTQDNGGFFYNATLHRLSLGIASAQAPLHVVIDSGTARGVRISDTAGTDYVDLISGGAEARIDVSAAKPLKFNVSGTTRLQITSGGDIRFDPASAFRIASGTIQTDGLGSTGLVKNNNGSTWTIAVAGTDYEPALTFNQGLSRSSNTITGDYITGKAVGGSGQTTWTGGTGTGEGIILRTTSHATKGKLTIGSSAYDEATDRWAINHLAPARRIDIQDAGSFQLRLGQSVGSDYDIGRNSSDGLFYLYSNHSTVSGFIVTGVNGDRFKVVSNGDVTIPSLGGGSSALVIASTAGLLSRATAGTDYTGIITLTAGNGLTGGGTTAASRTFDVVAGDATIVVNANDIVAGVMQTANYAADSVTYAKIQNISAADKLLGRGNGGGSGDTQEITLGTNLSMSGTTLNVTGSGAPTGAQYLTLATDAGLSAERVLTISTGLSASDGGANGNYTVTNDVVTGIGSAATWSGATSSGGTLTIRSSSNATKGDMTLQASQVLIPDSTSGSSVANPGIAATNQTTGIHIIGGTGIYFCDASTYSLHVTSDTVSVDNNSLLAVSGYQGINISPSSEAYFHGARTGSRDKALFEIGGAAISDNTSRTFFNITNATSSVSNGVSVSSWTTAKISQKLFSVPSGSATVTNATSLLIEGAPDVSSGSLTMTNKYGLWVQSSISRFDGDGTYVWQVPATTLGAPTAATHYISVNITGVGQRWIPVVDNAP